MCFSVMDCLNWICLLTARVCDICHDTGTKHPQQILEVVDSWSLCGREVDPNNWAEHNTAPSGCWDGLTVTLFTATGDFGLSCTETTQERGVHYPASSPCSYIRTIIRGDKQIHFPLKDAKGEGKHQILLNFFWSVRHASIGTCSTTYLVNIIYPGHCLGNPWYPKDFDLTWVASVLIWKVCSSDTLVW